MNHDVAVSALELLKNLAGIDLGNSDNLLALSNLQDEAKKLIRESKLADDCRNDTVQDWNRNENGYDEVFHRIVGFGTGGNEQMYVTIEDDKQNPIIDVIVEIHEGMPVVHINEGGNDCIMTAFANRETNQLMILDGGSLPEHRPEAITTDVRQKGEKGIAYKLR